MTPLVSAVVWGSINVAGLLFASSILVAFSKLFAQQWRISPLIISLIIVAFGTNLPEFVVTLSAIDQGDSGLAIGNLLGSSVANISLIFGASILFGVVKPGTVKTQKNAWMLLGVTLLFCGMSLLRVAHTVQALLLLAALLAVLSYQFSLGIHGRKAEDKASFARGKSRGSGTLGMLYRMLMFLGAIGLIWFSGNQVVDVVTTISRELHITTTLLGLTLTGVATSLPELLTAVTASLKRENKIVIGTVLGSNIFNLTLFPAIVFGTIGTWFITYSQFFSLLVSTGIFAWMLLRFRGKPIPKVYGIYLLFVYAIFLISSIFFQGTT